MKTKHAKTSISKICRTILVLVELAAMAVAEPSAVCTEAAAIVTSGGKITLSIIEMATIRQYSPEYRQTHISNTFSQDIDLSKHGNKDEKLQPQ